MQHSTPGGGGGESRHESRGGRGLTRKSNPLMFVVPPQCFSLRPISFDGARRQVTPPSPGMACGAHWHRRWWCRLRQSQWDAGGAATSPTAWCAAPSALRSPLVQRSFFTWSRSATVPHQAATILGAIEVEVARTLLWQANRHRQRLTLPCFSHLMPGQVLCATIAMTRNTTLPRHCASI